MNNAHEGTKPRRRKEKPMTKKSENLRDFVPSCEANKEIVKEGLMQQLFPSGSAALEAGSEQ